MILDTYLLEKNEWPFLKIEVVKNILYRFGTFGNQSNQRSRVEIYPSLEKKQTSQLETISSFLSLALSHSLPPSLPPFELLPSFWVVTN